VSNKIQKPKNWASEIVDRRSNPKKKVVQTAKLFFVSTNV